MGGKQFYLTLPSNSSTKYYPDNKTANYVTHLPRSIQLDGGAWEVALVEAHFPSTFRTLGDGEFIQYTIEVNLEPPASTGRIRLPGESVTFSLIEEKKETPASETKQIRLNMKPGNYETVEDLLQFINDYERFKNRGLSLSIDPSTGLLKHDDLPSDSPLKLLRLEMSPKLALLLGFDFSTDKGAMVVRPPDINLNKPSQMYVYCDLVDPQLVGDTVAPLLRMVNIDSHNMPYGATKTVHFHDPHYVPVLKSTFETVEIDLRDNKGEQLPFRFGTSCMKLHFRRETSS